MTAKETAESLVPHVAIGVGSVATEAYIREQLGSNERLRSKQVAKIEAAIEAAVAERTEACAKIAERVLLPAIEAGEEVSAAEIDLANEIAEEIRKIGQP